MNGTKCITEAADLGHMSGRGAFKQIEADTGRSRWSGLEVIMPE